MIIENLIWSGCSLSFGSGFIDERNADVNVKWLSEKLNKSFINTTIEAREWVKQISFPYQFGKKLGCKNIHNLSIHGFGIEPQLRKTLSFLINEKPPFDKTLIGIQIPNLSRIEIIDNTITPFKWLYPSAIINSPHKGIGYHFMTENYNLIFHQIKMIFELWKFKQILENLNYKSIFIEFGCYDRIRDLDYKIDMNINEPNIWNHESVEFPNIENLISYLNVLTINNNFSTFKSEGINEDLHFSEKGHTEISDYLLNVILNEKY